MDSSNKDISDSIITHCAECHEVLLDTDDLLISNDGNQQSIICTACFEQGRVNPDTQYSKCLIHSAWCPHCDESNIVFVASIQRCMDCTHCGQRIDVKAYEMVVIRQQGYPQEE